MFASLRLGLARRISDPPLIEQAVAHSERTGSLRSLPLVAAQASLRSPTHRDKSNAFAAGPQALRPDEQASALLAWLQSAGGRTGTIAASEMPEIHRSMCLEYGLAPCSWVAVARAFRKIINQPKEYESRNGRRLVVYRIPA